METHESDPDFEIEESLPHNEQKGIVREQALVAALRKLGCKLWQSEKLDKGQKIDFYCNKIDGRRLRPSVAVQVTLQRNNLTKLERFIEATRASPFHRHCYAEIDECCEMHLVAGVIKSRMLEIAALLSRKSRVDRSLIIEANGASKFIPLEERLTYVRRMVERGVKVVGWIEQVTPNAIVTRDIHRTEYYTHAMEIADRELRDRLRRHKDGKDDIRGTYVQGHWVLSKRGGHSKQLLYVKPFAAEIESAYFVE